MINEYIIKQKIYIDLCYLGLIQHRVYVLKGFLIENNISDPVHNPKKVHNVMSKILKWN